VIRITDTYQCRCQAHPTSILSRHYRPSLGRCNPPGDRSHYLSKPENRR